MLLTQIVDKHDYVQGGVQISLLGRNESRNESRNDGQVDGQEETFQLSELDLDKTEAIKFRFRYFQNIVGEVQLPEGFIPRKVVVVVQSSGTNAQRLEKKFDWLLKGE